jgi:allantoate deiminase
MSHGGLAGSTPAGDAGDAMSQRPERARISDRLTSMAAQALARCDEAATFTEEPGKVTRTFLSEPMRGLHGRLAGWMEAAGLRIRVDAAGNMVGRYDGLDPASPVLMIGSHLDTVSDAGRYDGVLGVMLGLAAVQALGGRRLPFGIDVIAFSEEEGVRYGVPYLGSLAAAGRFDRRLLERIDASGIAMADAFRAFGLDPSRIEEAAYPPGGLLGYLEAHIEQGPVLESLEAPVGVVEAISGQSRIRAEIRGRSGHAGTLPMAGRLDALAAAAELVLEVERLGRSVDGLRATVGTIAVEPGASNVVPGAARLSVDIRHPRDEVRTAAVAEFRARAASLAAIRGVEFATTHEEHHAAVPADPSANDLLCRAVERAGQVPHRLASGAGHDAAVMAAAAPMAMLFLRSPGGISHHPDESVRPEDVAVALDVMVRYLDLLADRVESAGGPLDRVQSPGAA